MNNHVNILFERLENWRHLPNYQLERRTDIFFSLYLTGLIEAKMNCKLSEVVIPEFPVKRTLVTDKKPSNKSYKIDYVAFENDFSRVFLVELKTDLFSRRKEQDDYLCRAKEQGFDKVLVGLVDIFKATQSRRKYLYLFDQLRKLGLVDIPNEVREAILEGRRARFDQIEITVTNMDSEIIYIQPRQRDDGEIVIDFDFINEYLDKQSDEFSALFRKYLTKWKNDPSKEVGDYI